MSDPPADHPVLLFDGDCALCNRWVAAVLRHERAPVFRFAAFQSEAGRALLAQHGVTSDPIPETMLVLAGSRVLERTDALAHIGRELRWPWRATMLVWLVPRPIRDGAYRWVARRRARLGPPRACDVRLMGSLAGRVVGPPSGDASSNGRRSTSTASDS